MSYLCEWSASHANIYLFQQNSIMMQYQSGDKSGQQSNIPYEQQFSQLSLMSSIKQPKLHEQLTSSRTRLNGLLQQQNTIHNHLMIQLNWIIACEKYKKEFYEKINWR